MKLSSSVFGQNQEIPAKYTCDGENMNPPLSINGVPQNTQSLALVVYDPDAPMGDWVHWTVWNIDPGTKEIAENSVPDGSAQGPTSFGMPGYGGPCPPSGTHRYIFTLYALDTNLDLEPNALREQIEAASSGHILAMTELVGLYSRR